MNRIEEPEQVEAAYAVGSARSESSTRGNISALRAGESRVPPRRPRRQPVRADAWVVRGGELERPRQRERQVSPSRTSTACRRRCRAR